MAVVCAEHAEPDTGARSLALALDNSGQAHLLWDVPSYGLPRFIYHSFTGINAAEPWSQPAPVATSLGESSLLYAPVPGPDGALHLLWHNLPNRITKSVCSTQPARRLLVSARDRLSDRRDRGWDGAR